MATLEELQAQLTALTQRVNEITAPPDDYYTHRFSGEEIDNAVDRVEATSGSGAITAGDVGAAPSGFGLGGPPKILTNADDLDDVINLCGWYYWNSSIPANAPPSSWGDMRYCYMHEFGGIQIVYNAYRKFQMMRIIYGGVGPWECINPPMNLGVEYRTTERYKGKPVYSKLVSFGRLPNSTSATVSHNSENVLDAISGDLVNQDGTLLNKYEAITQFTIGRTSIVVRTSRDMSSNVCTVSMKYIKTTD